MFQSNLEENNKLKETQSHVMTTEPGPTQSDQLGGQNNNKLTHSDQLGELKATPKVGNSRNIAAMMREKKAKLKDKRTSR